MLYGANALVFILYCMNTMCTQIMILYVCVAVCSSFTAWIMFSSSMVNFCAVVGCSNCSTRESSNKFYRLPAIVTDHFVKVKPASLYEQGDPDWAFSLKLGHSSVKVGTSAQGRHSRLLKRNQQKEAFQKQEAENMEEESEGSEQQGMASQSSAAVEKHVQTDLLETLNAYASNAWIHRCLVES